MTIEIRLTKDTETKELKQAFFVNKCKIDTECIGNDVAEEFTIMELQYAMMIINAAKTITEDDERISNWN